MLSHKVEHFLKTGDAQTFLQLTSIISEADEKYLKQIYDNINKVIDAANKRTGNKFKLFCLGGLTLGMSITHLLFLIDPCASEEMHQARNQLQQEQPFQYFLFDAAISTIGSLLGLAVGFIAQFPSLMDSINRIVNLQELMKTRVPTVGTAKEQPLPTLQRT